MSTQAFLDSVRGRLAAATPGHVRVVESWDKVTGEHNITFPDFEVDQADLRKLLAIVDCYEAALDSTARNTCCDTCQEAAKVARAALATAAGIVGEE